LELDLVHARLQLEELLVGLGQEVLVARLLGHLVAKLGIFEAGDDLAQRIYEGLEGLELRQDLLGTLLAFPEAGLGLAGLEFFELRGLGFEVKASHGSSRSAPRGHR
jgi:hypothetical protein